MNSLPPGQQLRQDFPRFGLAPYAERFPRELNSRKIEIGGDVFVAESSSIVFDPFAEFSPQSLTSHFHCVTTWTVADQQWRGVRFRDFYATHIAPLVRKDKSVRWIVLRGQDGYRTSLLLEDALADDVILADTLNGAPLTVEHGAPLRLIAPQHYGYKSMKHLKRIDFLHDEPRLKRGINAWMDHPRARVAYEERGQWLPGWFLRYLYRLFIASNVRRFQQAMQRYAQR